MCAIISWQATVNFIQVDSLDLDLILWNHGPFSQIYLPYTAQCSPSSQILPMMVREELMLERYCFSLKIKVLWALMGVMNRDAACVYVSGLIDLHI